MRTDCTYYCADVLSVDLMKKNTHLCTFSQKRHITATPLQADYQYNYSGSTLCSFNGKEKDWESGFHYYGARYYWSEVFTGWLSVDPMTDKYPSISPYSYCAWNPVKLIDPDGRDWYDVDESGHITKNEELSKKYKDNDVLYSTSTGERSKLFDKGTITSISNNNLNGKSGQIVCFGEGSTRDDHLSIFEFCANNTDVEFSLIQFEGGPSNTFMTTSHDLMSDDGKSSDDYGSEVTKAKDNPKSLVSHIHNHWANGMFGYGAQGDDFTFKEKVIELRGDMGEKPIFGIYKCGGDRKTRGYLNYDGEKIDPKTMKKL